MIPDRKIKEENSAKKNPKQRGTNVAYEMVNESYK
ncbi:hypothetical protein I588_00048 [Enterococcus pallens ATCC BAA-351]|uniref:Uncharacterized protein n=1 Tax=Enterococcus pallens ATCC BAA-351 TaxID=1158607 RepID=R2QCM4_9ENTE|nr:hypothetical protein UAU_01917 [Enterococcus pallens ATCC BAA-351]EOU24061.1 hypothetical protein I588_00048 [Enterococcus pallens ATCC BAA-351]